MIIAVNFAGCAEKAVPVSGAAEDLQARFDNMFEDDAEYETAAGTVRYEPETEPPTLEITTTTTETTTFTTEQTTAEALESEHEGEFVVTPSGKRYHVQNCRTVNNIKEYLTREEAESQGYTPCGICKP